MKVVRLSNNIIVEVIPNEALPVEQWYGPQFASQCVEAPDDTPLGWVYDRETSTFVDPTTIVPEPSAEERIAALESELEFTQGVLDAILMGDIEI